MTLQIGEAHPIRQMAPYMVSLLGDTVVETPQQNGNYMHAFGLLINFILALTLSVKADVIAPRFGSKCAYTFSKIYCYGGKLENKQYSNDLYSLNINSLSSGPVSDMISKWELVTANKSLDIPPNEYRYKSQFVLLPDGSMFFGGGYNEDNPLVAQNVTYNPQKNAWTVMPGPSYNDVENGGYRQIYSGTAVYLPSVNRVAFFGGRQLNAALNSNYTFGQFQIPNISYETISEQNPTKKLVESIYGYGFYTELNLDTREWTTPDANDFLVNNIPLLISDQTVTYHPTTRKVVYVGGVRRGSVETGYTENPGNVLTFDTINSNWKIQETTGISRPTARLGHTTTMLNTGDDILVYGGMDKPGSEVDVEGILSADYLYTLNLIAFRWTAYDRPSNSIGPRVYHSAVLVNDTTLFIMFGRKKSETADALVAANDIMLLNVTNMSFFSSLDTYPAPTIVDPATNQTSTKGQADGQSDSQSDNQSNSQSNNQSDAHESKGLSTGAIVGIVVGSVAVIAIIALAAIYRKKTRAKEEKIKEIQVDWDVIDGEYREDPPYGGRFSAGSANMSSTVVTPNVYEKPGQPYNTYSLALADSNLIRPDHKDV
ncbi:uncharacterized protein EV154DRAFT_573583 [Mucor mucedo]|uniref:uncharacterized protein n=1 Tax=Mucor mucedo TaxID=29922 RepID=UPI00221F7CD4|nr:uncharacterized protein EV154DRAFT_573583 [Mucor mucedo]KAI7887676.1 hypothetical protein EV154DRAFT_573583 [Mucor mucedo]